MIRCLRKKFPQAKIDFLIKQEFIDLIKTNPHLDHIYTYDKASGQKGLAVIKKQIQAARYDVIVDIHKNLRSLYLKFNSGARKVTVYHKRLFYRALFVLFKLNFYRAIKPVYLRYFEAVEEFQVHYDNEGTEVFVPSDETTFVDQQLASKGYSPSDPLLVVCPGASFSNKQWLPERFIEVAKHYLETKKYSIALLGGPIDFEVCEKMRKQLGTNVMNFAGQLKLIQSAALLRKATIVLTNDSGMMHLAQSQKKPVVAIFGSTTEELGYFPLPEKSKVVSIDIKCKPCTPMGANRCPKKHFECMKGISSSRVISAIESLHP